MATYRHPQYDGAHGPHPAGTSDDDAGAPDYYAVLGVSEDASGEEIRQAFRALAKRWHPDHFATASPEEQTRAEQHMKALIEAHAVLGDPVRRHEYERARREAIPWSPDGPDGEHAYAESHAYDYAYASASHARAEARAGRDSVYGEGDRRAVNPNGAGQALAVLCIVFAVAIGAHLLAKGMDVGVGGFVQIGAFLGLLALAYIFFQDDSFIARAANAYMEREPRGSQVRGAHPVPHPTTHMYTAPPSAHAHPHTAPPMDEEQRGALDFDHMVDAALASVPEEFREQMENVVVRVQDEPSEDDLRSGNVPPGHTLLGQFRGVPLTHQGVYASGPEVVTIFRGPIERYCYHDPERIRAQVRATVLHELAHHFGIDHDDMPEWVK